MSEGGITVYAQKMKARFREGLEAVRDGMRNRQVNFNDRLILFLFLTALLVILHVIKLLLVITS